MPLGDEQNHPTVVQFEGLRRWPPTWKAPKRVNRALNMKHLGFSMVVLCFSTVFFRFFVQKCMWLRKVPKNKGVKLKKPCETIRLVSDSLRDDRQKASRQNVFEFVRFRQPPLKPSKTIERAIKNNIHNQNLFAKVL